MVWSALGWDGKADVKEVLRQYGRYFIGPALGDRFAEGLLALEKNWEGPVLENAGIDETLKLFQAMERDAGPREKLNWRFQQALYRAYYDAYVRARLKHETATREAIIAKLREAKTTRSEQGDRRCRGDSRSCRQGETRRPSCVPGMDVLAEALFQSIRAQLSVRKYHGDTRPRQLARHGRRAAHRRRLAEGRVDRRGEIAGRGRPRRAAPGNHGPHRSRPRRVLRRLRRSQEPAAPRSRTGLGEGSRFRSLAANCRHRSRPGIILARWWHYAETHYETPLQAKYDGLDTSASYRVRVVYGGQERRKVRLTAGDGQEVHGWLSKPFEPVEFDIPKAATADGKLTLTWTPEPGAGGPGRGCQVCEVWVLKKP